jgi:hypothetical protein
MSDYLIINVTCHVKAPQTWRVFVPNNLQYPSLNFDRNKCR